MAFGAAKVQACVAAHTPLVDVGASVQPPPGNLAWAVSDDAQSHEAHRRRIELAGLVQRGQSGIVRRVDAGAQRQQQLHNRLVQDLE